MTDIQHYLAITVHDKLSDENRKLFYQIVKRNLPDGVLTTLQIRRPEKGLKNVSMVTEQLEDKICYKIVLSRDLTEREIQPIFEQLAEELEADINFEIDGSANVVTSPTGFDTSSYYDLSDYKKKTVAEKVAKYMHQRWMQERVDQGWRYGVEQNNQDKTHPMLRGWDDLPEAYRQVDEDLPGVLLDALADEGYYVCSESEYYKKS